MRLKGRAEFHGRSMTAQGQRVVILRVFIKKTTKTPRHEIDLALSRAKLIKTTEK